MSSTEREPGILEKMARKNEALQAAIDAQQVKLDKYRTEDFESRFYEACEALAKEKVRNAILQGENKALKSKRLAEGNHASIKVSEAVLNAAHYQNGANQDVSLFEKNKGFNPLTENERLLADAVAKLLMGFQLYGEAIEAIL